KIQLHVNLQARAVLLEMGKTGLALQANGDNSSRYSHVHSIACKFFGRLFAILSQDLRDGMRELKPVGIGPLAQGINLLQLFLPQLVNFFFERHVEFALMVKLWIINERSMSTWKQQ